MKALLKIIAAACCVPAIVTWRALPSRDELKGRALYILVVLFLSACLFLDMVWSSNVINILGAFLESSAFAAILIWIVECWMFARKSYELAEQTSLMQLYQNSYVHLFGQRLKKRVTTPKENVCESVNQPPILPLQDIKFVEEQSGSSLCEVTMRRPSSRYIMLDDERHSVRILAPLSAAYRGMSTDESCQSHAEIEAFCSNIKRELSECFDWALYMQVVGADEHKRTSWRIIAKQLSVYNQIISRMDLDCIRIRQALLGLVFNQYGGLFSKPCSVDAIQLDSCYIREAPSIATHTFSSVRSYSGLVGLLTQSLLESPMPHVPTFTEKVLKCFQGAEQTLVNSDDVFDRLKHRVLAVLSQRFSSFLESHGLPFSHTLFDVVHPLRYQTLSGKAITWIVMKELWGIEYITEEDTITFLLNMCIPCLNEPLVEGATDQSAFVKVWREGVKSEEYDRIRSMAVLTQFFVAHVNIVCRRFGWSTKNFGKILDSDLKTSTHPITRSLVVELLRGLRTGCDDTLIEKVLLQWFYNNASTFSIRMPDSHASAPLSLSEFIECMRFECVERFKERASILQKSTHVHQLFIQCESHNTPSKQDFHLYYPHGEDAVGLLGVSLSVLLFRNPQLLPMCTEQELALLKRNTEISLHTATTTFVFRRRYECIDMSPKEHSSNIYALLFALQCYQKCDSVKSLDARYYLMLGSFAHTLNSWLENQVFYEFLVYCSITPNCLVVLQQLLFLQFPDGKRVFEKMLLVSSQCQEALLLAPCHVWFSLKRIMCGYLNVNLECFTKNDLESLSDFFRGMEGKIDNCSKLNPTTVTPLQFSMFNANASNNEAESIIRVR